MPSPDSAVRVDDLVVKFGRHAVLDGLALEAKAGALTAVLGPNGAGKTTLIRCCTDLLRPSRGTVSLLGLPAGSKMLAGRIGLMPQSAGSWSGIKAIELLRYLAGLYANPVPVAALVERLGLADCVRTPTGGYPAANSRRSTWLAHSSDGPSWFSSTNRRPAWTRMPAAPPGCCCGSCAPVVSRCC